MRRLLRLWLISTLLACTIALSAAPGNVILILCNGVNLAQLELARQAGIRRAGLSGMAALPSAGTLLPLTGRYRSQQIAALNALASGYAGDTTLGVTSSGDELESLLGEARLQGRRTGFITDGALNDWPGGAFFARENPLPRLDRIEAWLPLCDIDFLGGALVRSKPVTLEPLEMPMSRLGYQLVRTPGSCVPLPPVAVFLQRMIPLRSLPLCSPTWILRFGCCRGKTECFWSRIVPARRGRPPSTIPRG